MSARHNGWPSSTLVLAALPFEYANTAVSLRRVLMSQRPSSSIAGVSMALGAAVLWGTTGTAQTFAGSQTSPYWVGALRLAVASVFFVLLITLHRWRVMRRGRLAQRRVDPRAAHGLAVGVATRRLHGRLQPVFFCRRQSHRRCHRDGAGDWQWADLGGRVAIGARTPSTETGVVAGHGAGGYGAGVDVG